jgi:O-antigen/teichoic acid export membrane protein
LFSKIFKTFGVKFSSAVINFLIAVIISQFLGASGKGEQGIIITTVTLILLFSNIVGGAALVYLTPRLNIKKIMLLSYLWTLFTSLLFIIVLFLFPLTEQKFIIHIVILAALNSFTSINSSILLGKENIRANNIISFFQILITILSLLFFFVILNQYSVFSYIYSLYIAYVLSYALSIIFLYPYFKRKSIIENDTYRKAISMLFRYGFVNQLSHIAQLMSFRVSYYFLDHYFGYKSVGIYSNGVSIIESVWMISGSIALVQYSKIANTNDDKSNQKLTVDLLRISSLVTFIVLIPLVLLPSSFYSFIFGKDFYDINRIIWCLAPGILIYVNALILGHYFSGTGKYHINTLGSTLGLMVTVILAFILIPRYGYLGSAVTATLSYATTSLFIIIYFCSKTKTRFWDLLPMPRHISGYLILLKQFMAGKNKINHNE